jgi:uncharacterized membrane protein
MVTTTSEKPRRGTRYALGLAIPAALGLLLSFIATIVSFSAIEAGGAGTKLVGADNELGFPSSAFGMVFFVIVLAVAMAEVAGAALGPAWWRALVPVAILAVLFEGWALVLAFTPLTLAQLVTAIGALVLILTLAPRGIPDTALGTALVVAAVIGFFAAFRLTVDKVGTYIDPAVAPSCNYSVLVQCGKNLASWQGSLFGFPNPLLGVGGWVAVLVIGILILSGAPLARWFWIATNVGLTFALAFVIWLISQSIFSLATLCPWCMTTWAVVIPSFWLITFHNLKEGVFTSSSRVRGVFGNLYGFVPLVTLVSYLVIALIAQVRLDVLSYL